MRSVIMIVNFSKFHFAESVSIFLETGTAQIEKTSCPIYSVIAQLTDRADLSASYETSAYLNGLNK